MYAAAKCRRVLARLLYRVSYSNQTNHCILNYPPDHGNRSNTSDLHQQPSNPILVRLEGVNRLGCMGHPVECTDTKSTTERGKRLDREEQVVRRTEIQEGRERAWKMGRDRTIRRREKVEKSGWLPVPGRETGRGGVRGG